MLLPFKNDPLFSREIETADASRFYVEVKKVSMEGTRLVLSQYFGFPVLSIPFKPEHAEALLDDLSEAVRIARTVSLDRPPTSHVAQLWGYFFPIVLFRRATPVDCTGATLTVRTEQTPKITNAKRHRIVLHFDRGEPAPDIYFDINNVEQLIIAVTEAEKILRSFLSS